MEAIDQGALFPFRHLWLNPNLELLGRGIVAVTFLGHPFALLGVALLSVVGFLVRGQTRAAVLVALALGLAAGAAYGIKVLVDRPRPNVGWAPIAEPATPSFPSGYTLGATALYVTLGMLLSRRTGRPSLRGVGVGLAFLVGLSRLLIGHNFVTDVLAAWALGTLIVMVCVKLDGPPPAS
jgi:undecaprenyl-diphosphatase